MISVVDFEFDRAGALLEQRHESFHSVQVIKLILLCRDMQHVRARSLIRFLLVISGDTSANTNGPANDIRMSEDEPVVQRHRLRKPHQKESPIIDTVILGNIFNQIKQALVVQRH